MRRGAGLLILALLFSPAAPVRAQDVACVRPVEAPPPVPRELDVHRISRGEGVRVAVIDTGVAPHPDLGHVEPVADLVSPWAPDPLFDCDGHGTVVAGVIREVAPSAQILSIRQSSGHYRDAAGGTLDTLTQAIHAALDAGAQVINISVVSCLDPTVLLDATPLHHALRRAEEDGVVIIAAAGNAGGQCQPGMVVHPAHEETVLAVGAVHPEDPHALAGYVLPGGQVAAAGRVPVGLSPTGHGHAAGTVNAQGQEAAFEGTSFAAPVVSGVAALLRERHPFDTAADLRHRIVEAAEPGHGVVDTHKTVTHLAGDYAREGRAVGVGKHRAEPDDVPTRAGALLLAALLAALLTAPARAGRPRA